MKRLSLMNAIRAALAAGINATAASIDALIAITADVSGAVTAGSVAADSAVVGARIVETQATRPIFFPSPGTFEAEAGVAPAALFLCNDGAHASGLRDAIANADLAAVAGISLYGFWTKNRQGVKVPTAGFGWARAAALAPGTTDYMLLSVFSQPAHAAEDLGIVGYDDTTALNQASLIARVVSASDKVAVYIADFGNAHTATVTVNHALVFGDLYALGIHVNRATDFLYTRLVNLTTGLVYTGTPLDISAYGDITGGVAPQFQVGAIAGRFNAQTISHFGHAVIRAGISAADALETVMQNLGAG